MQCNTLSGRLDVVLGFVNTVKSLNCLYINFLLGFCCPLLYRETSAATNSSAQMLLCAIILSEPLFCGFREN